MEIEKIVREPVVPDSALLIELRDNFTVLKCSELLARITRDICAALGVTVKYEITHVDEGINIKRSVISKSLAGLITVVSAILAGSKVSPHTLLKDTYDVNKAQKIIASRKAANQLRRVEAAQDQRETQESSDATHQETDGGGESDNGSEHPPA